MPPIASPSEALLTKGSMTAKTSRSPDFLAMSKPCAAARMPNAVSGGELKLVSKLLRKPAGL